MSKHLLIAVTLIFVFSFTAFSQSHIDCSRFATEYEQQQCEQRLSSKTFEINRTRFLKPQTNLLSDKGDAWILHIITFGGFDGKGLPTITVRSNGDFACGESRNLQFDLFEQSKMNVLSEVISSANFITATPAGKTTSSVSNCSDCYQTKILLARREANGKTKFYRNDSNSLKYPQIAEKFDSIQQNVINSGICRN